MCFIIHEHYKKPRKAWFNKKCYKEVYSSDGILFSSCRGYKYHLNERNPKINLCPYLLYNSDKLAINEGYHSFKTRKMAKNNKSKSAVIVKCIIPRGSTYYYNPKWKEYVSSSIIIKEILK